ncbi:MAG: hypothetical protein GXP32_08845 [Kiritimatiellaeota bacterium]|nr:hypothetical protein [Kiritimatiellota bacterium]
MRISKTIFTVHVLTVSLCFSVIAGRAIDPDAALAKLNAAKGIEAKNKAINDYLSIPLFQRNLPENVESYKKFREFIIDEAKSLMNKKSPETPDSALSTLKEYKIALFANIAMAAHYGMREAKEFMNVAKGDSLALEVFSYAKKFLRRMDARKRLQKMIQAKIEEANAKREADIKRMKKEPINDFLPKLKAVLKSDLMNIDDKRDTVLIAAIDKKDFNMLDTKQKKEIESLIMKALNELKSTGRDRSMERMSEYAMQYRMKERALMLIGIHSCFAKGPLERLFLKKIVQGEYPEIVKKVARDRAEMLYGSH